MYRGVALLFDCPLVFACIISKRKLSIRNDSTMSGRAICTPACAQLEGRGGRFRGAERGGGKFYVSCAQVLWHKANYQLIVVAVFKLDLYFWGTIQLRRLTAQSNFRLFSPFRILRSTQQKRIPMKWETENPKNQYRRRRRRTVTWELRRLVMPHATKVVCQKVLCVNNNTKKSKKVSILSCHELCIHLPVDTKLRYIIK